MIDTTFRHFLRYNQEVFDGNEYGSTDLFYNITDSSLLIKSFDTRASSENTLELPLKEGKTDPEGILTDFLTDFMSHRGNFFGEPIYESSELFSKEAFEKIKQNAIRIMDSRIEAAIREGSDKEIIKFCKTAGLYPEPYGETATNWKANCPSKGKHFIMISIISNEWGCGYCRKKGDLNSLKEWVQKKALQ